METQQIMLWEHLNKKFPNERELKKHFGYSTDKFRKLKENNKIKFIGVPANVNNNKI